MENQDEKNRKLLVQISRKFNWIFGLRPAILAEICIHLFTPRECRRIVRTASGLRLFVDPFAHQGRSVVLNGKITEPEMESLFKAHLKERDTVLDLGANEGVISALAGLFATEGLIIAVEPQTKLRDIIEINLRINNVKNFKIFSNAFGGTGSTRLNIFPTTNTGASSIVGKYRFSRKSEEVYFISIEEIMRECNIRQIDFVKVDVEGFEAEVVDSLLPAIRQGNVKKILVEYHAKSLSQRNIKALDIHTKLITAGMEVIQGDIETLAPSSQVFYGSSA